ncbi:RCC1-like domain-containing protein [Actinocrispum wychmicini]|uniref:Alpha-tubulin suppressor-like RCC1 family protein n=1 Tax=Actinocrispum wychmicini TaxID=1213861 RepID=A0A4R2JC64_9PSEU|nr:RCC1 domain-containing protein [Actinocrispum wychmicini]TCO54328.1 alpha-tubulin suppressor-like RCC1 family protein [Actinocrispum wychmicini]
MRIRRSVTFAFALVLGAVLVGAPASIGAPASPMPVLGAASRYTPLAPVRVLDTRSGLGAPAGAVGPGRTITVDLSAKVPAGATAVVVNLTGTGATAATYVTAWPTGEDRPTVSNINLLPNQTRPNAVTVRLGADRKVDLFNDSGSTHLIVDLAGYYGPDGSKYAVLDPVRVLDTRSAPAGAVGPGGTISLDLSAKVPATATAVVFNLTGTGPTAATFVTAWPHGQARPVVSNLNLAPGETAPNLVTVRLGADRKVDLFNDSGSTHLIADLAGYYDPAADALFVPRTPQRLLDTRTGQGRYPQDPGPLGPGQWERVNLWALTGPSDVVGVVANLTGIVPSANTFLTASPGYQAVPAVSNLNLAAGQIAANMISLGADRYFNLYNDSGETHVAIDVAGYFVRTCSGVSGCVFAWGQAEAGQLGDGTVDTDRPQPKPVRGLSEVTAVAGGLAENLALRSDGTVWAWGTGQDVPGGKSLVAVQVPGLANITRISAGRNNGLAMRSDGTVWAWGKNDHGQLGDGVDHGPDGSPTPVRVLGLTDVVAIATSGTNGYAVRSNGTVFSWGDNTYAQLGTGTLCDKQVPGSCQSNVPVQVSGLTGAVAVSEDGFALRSDGTAWTWGTNYWGVLGANLPLNSVSAVPVQVYGLTGVAKISGTMQNRYALKSDGTVWSWGPNREGQLGNGTTGGNTIVPVQVSGIANATSIGSGEGLNGYAVTPDGQVLGWGYNIAGQLGPNAPLSSNVPVRVTGLAGATEVSGYYAGAIALVPHPAN